MLSLTTLFILGFYLISVVVFVVSLLRAPQGYEDSKGFHFGLVPAPVMLARRRPAAPRLSIHTF